MGEKTIKLKHRKTTIWTPRTFKVVVLLLGLYLLYAATRVLIHGDWSILYMVVVGLWKIIGFCIPYFLSLVMKSLLFLWPPILAYVLIRLITTSRWWRFYLYLSGLAVAILILKYFVFSRLDFSIETLKQIPNIFLYMIQFYIFLLLIFPREVWNLIGGILFAIQSFIITIMPDLPTYFDDLGMILAVFAFIFIYINFIASIIQRFVDDRVIRRLRQLILSIILKTPLKKYIFSQQSVHPIRDVHESHADKS